jgi:hypothetical protein
MDGQRLAAILTMGRSAPVLGRSNVDAVCVGLIFKKL